VEGGDFVRTVGLDRVGVGITEEALWRRVSGALDAVVSHLGLTTAAVYCSSHGDCYDLRAVVVPPARPAARSFAFRSYEEFASLVGKGAIDLPSATRLLAWVSPEDLLGTERAIVFANETTTGNIVLVAFGHQQDTRLDLFQRAILSEAVQLKVFRFLETGLLGIELDYLMQETGHLLGRAWGKISSGYSVASGFLPPLDSLAADDAELLVRADWAIQEGLERMELTRQNFYSFRARRLGESEIPRDESGFFAAPRESGLLPRGAQELSQVDVVSVLNDLEPFFSNSIEDTELREVQMEIECQRAIVKGLEDCLRLVFINLFDNAIKFAYNDTYVTVKLECTDDECTVRFTNLGIGVPGDERKRVFLPLRKSRFRNPFKRIEGLGHGL
jgi:signal transduction histidine kinase